ncbi:hypothetical protein AMTR_s00045p00136300 [Amborella trichopoda]|uniref:Pentatricopeptide repeat-containing protein n=1 Tax=Amborella trichopoda TaxID=13333 RepID=W1P2B4_AMBTC|nr:hypothetical protein AMTR_s00045p00136300 [Amborella trichopoda]
MRVLLLKPNTKPKSPHPHTLSPNCLYTAPQISSPTPTDFSSQLSKFTHLQNIKNGRKAHAQIIKTGCTSFPFLHNSLINMYAKCGQTYESLLIFESTQENNVISWTSAISAFVRGNMPYKAMSLFSRMRREGTQPNQFTLSAILPSCWELKNGVQIHSLACKNGFSSDVFVASALVDMYSKCLDMVGARKGAFG